MDSNQFTQELVEFSGVEQQINTNSNLQTLISLAQGNSTANAVSYLGKTVTITNGDAPLQSGQANWTYALGAASNATTLTITNSAGQVVYTGAGETAAGQHAFAWNGEDNAGNQLPDGTYTLAVNATASDGSTVDAAVASTGVVSEVDLSNSEPELLIGNMEVPVSAVTAILSS
jgi:flagellar basal-body rod modification protein FlgD